MSSAQAEELEDWQIDADEAAEKIERAKEAEDGNYSASAAPRVKKAKAGPRLSLAEKVAKLEELLKRAEAYAQFMNENMEEDEDEEGGGGASSSSSSSPGGTKRKRDSSEAPPQEDGGVHQGPNGALNALTGTLHDYQVEGVLWLTRLFENGSHGILADEMGLGKTIQVIGLLTFMRHVGVKGPFIIVAPLSTIQNWCNEIEKWSGGTMSCVKYHGSKAERPGIMRRFMPTSSQSEASFPIVVTSYEMVKMDLEKLCRYKWKMCVVDEGHALKNSSCQLFAALKRLAGIEGCTRLLLTGTPLQNNLQELWSLLNFLLPEQFVDVDTFLAWFDMMQGGSADEVMEQEKTDSLVSKLHRILTPFVLRRTKLGVLPPDALPPKREVVVFCGMTQPQRWLYGAIHTHRLHDAMKQAATIGLNVVGKKMGNGTRGIPSMQNKMMQLRKCCMHPYLFFEPTASGETDENIVQFSGKMIILDRIMRHCKAGGHRVLIFSQFSKTLDILEDYMNLRKWGSCRIDGSVSEVDRAERMQQFNDPANAERLFSFILTTRAGGQGINLASADTVVLFDSDWNPHQDSQAQARAHRLGQKGTDVTVYRLIADNSVEVRLLETANEKRKLARMCEAKGSVLSTKGKIAKLTATDMKRILSDDVDIASRSDDSILRKGLGDSTKDREVQTTPWILLEPQLDALVGMGDREIRSLCRDLEVETVVTEKGKKTKKKKKTPEKQRKRTRAELVAALKACVRAHRAAEPDAPTLVESASTAASTMGLDDSEPWTSGGINERELLKILDRDPEMIASLDKGGKEHGYEVVVHAPAALGSTGSAAAASGAAKARKVGSRSSPRRSGAMK